MTTVWAFDRFQRCSVTRHPEFGVTKEEFGVTKEEFGVTKEEFGVTKTLWSEDVLGI